MMNHHKRGKTNARANLSDCPYLAHDRDDSERRAARDLPPADLPSPDPARVLHPHQLGMVLPLTETDWRYAHEVCRLVAAPAVPLVEIADLFARRKAEDS